jgi:hypothetical protein
MRQLRFRCWVVLAGCVALCNVAHAGIAGLTQVASGLTNPVYATHAPGDRERLFIVELGSPIGISTASASIRILNLKTGIMEPTPFLTITDVDTRSAGGVGGLAFHPNYANNGRFYVNMTANDTIPGSQFSTYIREYTVSGDPNVANSSYTGTSQRKS